METANADDPQVDAVVDEEEQTVVTKVAQILNKRMVKGQSSDTEVNKYQKYQAIMFGNEDEEFLNDVDPADPLYSGPTALNKAPKASKERRVWTQKEEEEILSHLDFTTMTTQPKAADSKRLLKLSAQHNGELFKGKRTVSALNNKLIRMWKHHKK